MFDMASHVLLVVVAARVVSAQPPLSHACCRRAYAKVDQVLKEKDRKAKRRRIYIGGCGRRALCVHTDHTAFVQFSNCGECEIGSESEVPHTAWENALRLRIQATQST